MMVLHGNSFDAVFSNAARGGFDRSSVSFVYVDLYDAIACREVLVSLQCVVTRAFDEAVPCKAFIYSAESSPWLVWMV